ncbi:MAG: urease accessory protein UreE [Pseudomonadota bacterium]
MTLVAAEPITLTERTTSREAIDSVALPFEARQKTRQRVSLSSGRDGFVKLSRGAVLRGGDCITNEDGYVVRIDAAIEAISRVRSREPAELARAAYHLGNRHVWVEVGRDALSYLRDHVLDEMLEQLGFAVEHDDAPFEPEAGAYDGHGH